MPVSSKSFDADNVEWRHVTDPSCTEFTVDFEYSLLGCDLDAGRLNMMLRYASSGHCRRHRHVASTVTLVLDCEQFQTEIFPDGSTKKVHRKTGDCALAVADANPRDEYGDPDGGTVLLSMSTPNGVLFEYFDEKMESNWTVSIEEYVDAWNHGTVHGCRPDTLAAE